MDQTLIRHEDRISDNGTISDMEIEYKKRNRISDMETEYKKRNRISDNETKSDMESEQQSVKSRNMGTASSITQI